MRLILDGLAGIYFLTKGSVQDTAAIFRAHIAVYRSMGKFRKKRKALQGEINSWEGPKENLTGQYSKSILWKHYINKVQHASQLEMNDPKK